MFTPTNQLSQDEMRNTVSPKVAADLLGLKTATLAFWRSTDPHKLPFHRTGKTGGRVLYFQKHLEEYMSQHTQGLPCTS